MTTAERLRAEGHAAGRAELLIEQLTHKFGSLPVDIINSIHATDPALLRTWALRVLTANTFDDVFA
ncbi:hypothetical protein [Nocardia lijiangensis]|uniref:hypothetical protein n=1 Tax=Nocardia lijiangensis TaxID=299618 RepID=UPI0008363190|nr:hypothetical protein [Nocardia lijiangensis]